MRKPKETPKIFIRAWTIFFLSWIVLLSGILPISGQGPGVKQAIKLYELLNSRKDSLSRLEKRIESVQKEIQLLNSDAFVQEQEIRRVLGYTSPNEIIFHFKR